MGNFKRFRRGHIGLQVVVLLAGFGSVVFGSLAFDFPVLTGPPEVPGQHLPPNGGSQAIEPGTPHNPLGRHFHRLTSAQRPLEDLFEVGLASKSAPEVESFQWPAGRITLRPEELTDFVRASSDSF